MERKGCVANVWFTIQASFLGLSRGLVNASWWELVTE